MHPAYVVYLVLFTLFVIVVAVFMYLKARQLERRLDDKIAEKNRLFTDNQTLTTQNQGLTAENTKWRERVTNAENSRDLARQNSVTADAKLVTMRQELNAAQAVARSVAIEVDREKRIKELELAIVKHRDAKGHDRCFENDEDLYKLIGETYNSDRGLPALPEFMSGCASYYESQTRRRNCGGPVQTDSGISGVPSRD